MKAQARFQKVQSDALNRFRSRFHAQSEVVFRSAKKLNRGGDDDNTSKQTQSVGVLSRRLNELRLEHARSGSTDAADRARLIVETFPTYSVDEDPKLVSSMRLLRAAGYFRFPPSMNSVAFSTEMLLRHTYLFEPQLAATFVSCVSSMAAPNAAEMLKIVAPRLLELAEDFYVDECAVILTAYRKFDVPNLPLFEALANNVAAYAESCSPADLSRAVTAISHVSSLRFEPVMNKVASCLLPDGVLSQLGVKPTVELCRALGRMHFSHRRLLNKIAAHCSTLLAKFNALEIAEVMHSFQVLSFKCEALLMRCAVRQLLQVESQTVASISLTLSALAHFHLPEHEAFMILGDKLHAEIQRVSTFHCSVLLHAFARAEEPHATLLPALVQRFALGSSSQSNFSLCNAFWAIGKLSLFHDDRLQKSMVRMLNEVRSRMQSISGDPVHFEMVLEGWRLITSSSEKGVSAEGQLREAVEQFREVVGGVARG